jgi:hypothetical protein
LFEGTRVRSSWCKHIAVAAGVLAAAAGALDCESAGGIAWTGRRDPETGISGLPEPPPRNPKLASVTVFVDPPDIRVESNQCRKILGLADLANSLRAAVRQELQAAGMKTVPLEVGQPDPGTLGVATVVVLTDCDTNDERQFVFDGTQDLLFRYRGEIIWREWNAKRFTGSPDQFAKGTAALLVRLALPSIDMVMAWKRKSTVTSTQAAPTSTGGTPYAEAPVDPAKADALFREGRQLMKAGQLAQACEKYGASLAFDPAAGTLMNLADCEERVGRLTNAHTHWQQLLRSLPQTGDTRRDHAQQRLADVESRLPALTVRLAAGAPEGTRILLDNLPLADRAVGRAVYVTPGDHVVTVEAPGRAPLTYSVSLREAEKRDLAVDAGGGAPAAAASAGHR